MNEYLKKLEDFSNTLQANLPALGLEQKKQSLLEIEEKLQDPKLWDDQANAQKITTEHAGLQDFINFWQGLVTKVQEAKLLASEAKTEQEIAQLESDLDTLIASYEKNRLVLLFSKKYDDHNAIFSIHAGAGGTDAQDWAEMILRMLLRYCQKENLSAEVIETNKGSEAGIKSATVQVRGPFAFGYLKSEAGVHRLVRLSPFNPAHTRETSFALVEVLPELEETEVTSFDPKDLKIEATTSSGAGGQSVNTTYSAIRVTHIPTGIKVSIQNERSQHQNKELALKILMAKVQNLEDEKLAKEKKELRGEFKSAEWGNQIRSYVLHPYKLVKDHRTNFETSDTQKVLDGELDEFVQSYLESQLD